MAAEPRNGPAVPEEDDARIVEVADERDPMAREALEVIRDTFAPQDRQPLERIAEEITEKRLGLQSWDGSYHLLAALSETGRAMGVVAGVYLGAANAGLVAYLGVRGEYRARELGRNLRHALMKAFHADARRLGRDAPAWVVGEVRFESPWLRRLVRERAAIPFHFTYYHPGVGPGWSDERWVLYRQPVGDARAELPASEVKQLVYAIWRRAYRVRFPLEHEGFRAMMEELEQRALVGPHPEVTG